MLAGGGEAIGDLAALRDQGEVFGPVASTPTAWRLLAAIDERVLDSLRSARAQAREVAWLQASETRCGIPAAKAGGRELPGLVLDIDATLITCHSEKETAAPTYKGGFGFHPLLCFLANTGEAVAGRLRPGNAGANTAADHIAVLDDALAQIPDAHRHGTDILVRTDSAGSAKAFLTHVRNLRTRGIRTFFSVGYAVTEPVRRAIRALPEQVWHPALDQDGTLRESAEVAELTGMPGLAGYPDGTRIIVRRERPHPGAQLSLFDQDEGLRHQAFLTDTPHHLRPGPVPGSPPPPARHRRGPHPMPPDSAASPPAASTSTPPGSNSASRPSTFSPGPASSCWTANSRLPNPRNSATGSCTSPPASPGAAAASAFAYPRPGPGDINSRPHTTAWLHYPVPPSDPPSLPTSTQGPGRTRPRAGPSPCPPTDPASNNLARPPTSSN